MIQGNGRTRERTEEKNPRRGFIHGTAVPEDKILITAYTVIFFFHEGTQQTLPTDKIIKVAANCSVATFM